MPTVFVSIASYRDHYCSRTLESIFENAADPTNIRVGICIQNDDADEDCVISNPKLAQYNPNISTIRMRHFEAKGPTWARYLCATLYNKEDYFLQVDSHTLFAKDWDAKLVNMISEIKANTPSDDVILSHYPPSYEEYGKEGTNPKMVSTICASFFNDRGMISFPGAESIDMSKETGYVQTAYIAAGMFFCEGKCLRDVPYDPHLPNLFVGEEISHSIRCWTSGYDIYSPNENVVYHLYTRSDQPHIWDDKKDNKHYSDEAATNKIKALLELDSEAPGKVPEHIKENSDKYGLGKKRTLQEYYDFAGIDVAGKTVNKNFCKKPESSGAEGFSSMTADDTNYIMIALLLLLGAFILNVVFFSNKLWFHGIASKLRRAFSGVNMK